MSLRIKLALNLGENDEIEAAIKVNDLPYDSTFRT